LGIEGIDKRRNYFFLACIIIKKLVKRYYNYNKIIFGEALIKNSLWVKKYLGEFVC
jgi:hypothetical protein